MINLGKKIPILVTTVSRQALDLYLCRHVYIETNHKNNRLYGVKTLSKLLTQSDESASDDIWKHYGKSRNDS